MLDVGCGLGYFAERARASGWNVTGCEPSAAWSAAARRRLGSGVVIEGVLDDVPANHRFDLITAWDVLEHIFDPIHFLGQIAVLLAPGGRLFIRTPNARYVLAVYRARRRLGHNVELGPLNHVVLFDAHSLRRALARAGLRPCSWRVLPPPQVDTFATGARRHRGSGPVVRAKNTWARTADELATRSRGRLVLGSDLDVLARLT